MLPTTTSSFTQAADRLLEPIDAALSRYADFPADCPEQLREAIRYSLLAPGKRLRPLLALLAAEACGEDALAAMPAACAVEMIHAYSLVHDDLPAMDDDDLRRGRPTCHKRFGEAMAILTGDALLALAFETLAADLPPEAAGPCCRELAHAAGATALVGGQADDLQPPLADADIAALESIHRRKTGALFLASLRTGAMAVGADKQQLQSLTAYGQNLGLAFQVVDDLLDVGGDEQQLGKRTGKDDGRGKLTYPGLLGIEESRRRAKSLTAAAREALAPFGDRAAALGDLARFVLERNR